MYDTIEIRSPKLNIDQIIHIRNAAEMLQRIDMETGEVLFQITTASLKGSYDSRLSIQIVQGEKVKISGSVHKFILGHNCFGGPTEIRPCCRYLVTLAQKRLGIQLPQWSKWELLRADVAHVFNLGSIDNVREYMREMRGCTYPRRIARNYGLFGFYFPGASTTLKAYNKGPEFRAHDKARLKKLEYKGYFTEQNIDLLEDLANCLLRFEVEVRSRQLKYDNVCLDCGALEDDYFERVYKREVLKVLKEGESGMNICKNTLEVQERLKEVYEHRKAMNLFNVWSRIQVQGAEKVKSEYCRTAWYNYRKDFAAAGVSLYGNVKVYEYKNELLAKNDRLQDFVPLPGEKNHIPGIFLDVNEAIKQLELIA